MNKAEFVTVTKNSKNNYMKNRRQQSRINY